MEMPIHRHRVTMVEMRQRSGQAEPVDAWRGPVFRAAPWLILVLGLVITWVTWTGAADRVRHMQRDHFQFEADQAGDRIRQRLNAYEQVLHGARGLFAAAGQVDRATFRRYVESLELNRQYPGIQGLGFAQVVRPHEKDAHVAAVRQEGYPDYELRPPGLRDLYSSIVYLEPFEGRNLRAFGYDMFSESVRREAMERARDGNRATISGKVRLVQETGIQDQAGFLMYLPVYRQSSDTVAERHAHLVGWVYAPFRMGDFLQGIDGALAKHLVIELFDGPAPLAEARMHVPHRPDDPQAAPVLSWLRDEQVLELAQHQWLMRVTGRASLVDHVDSGRPELIAFIGGAISLLLAFATWLLVTGRERALEAARRMNRDLRASEERIRHQNQRLSEIIWGTHVGTWEWNVQTGQVEFSERWADIVGYTLDELAPLSIETWLRLVHPEDAVRSEARLQRCFARETPDYECEARMRHKNGEWVWVLDRGRVVEWTDDGRPLRMAGTHQDITARKQDEAALQLAASVFTHAREGILITDPEGAVLTVNRTFTDITGYTLDEIRGRNPRVLNSGRQPPSFYAEMWRQLQDRGAWSGEVWNRRKSGEFYAELLTISAVRDAAGAVTHYLGLFTDITPMKQQQVQLERLAHYDALTGLPNRVVLADRLQQAMGQSQRRHQCLAVAFIDLDGFKAVNDTHGHDAGDELLVAVSARMKEALRQVDTLARMGGDEFVALMVDLTQPEDVEPLLQRMLLAASQPVTLRTAAGTVEVRVSASIGVTVYPYDAADAEVLMRHADMAMYAAKQGGRNQYRFFEAMPPVRRTADQPLPT
jgi:diguanylate cyclase (GGDEF)-like protein/PAS domain S-box-containing protein